MELIGLSLVLAVALFVLYRIGAIKLAQTASDKVIRVTDISLTAWELSAETKHTATLGKIMSKLEDDTVKRASAKSVRAKLAELDTVIK